MLSLPAVDPARLLGVPVPGELRDAERAAGVAGRGLDPELA